MFAATLISPLEMLRTKMQSTVLSYAEVRRAVSTSVRSHGALFMMRGLGPSLLRDVPFSGQSCLDGGTESFTTPPPSLLKKVNQTQKSPYPMYA